MTATQQSDRLEAAFQAMIRRRHGMDQHAAYLDAAATLARLIGLLEGWAKYVEPLPDKLVEDVAGAMERGG